MEKPEMILGYAEYNNDKYPFVYEDGILNLLPGNVEEWDKQRISMITELGKISVDENRHKWIEKEHIRGLTNKQKNIIFISNELPSNNNGFIQYKIETVYEYEKELPNKDLINGLIIKSNEIDYFFDPRKILQSEVSFDEGNVVEAITFTRNSEWDLKRDCGAYKSEDVSIDIEVSAFPKINYRSDKPLSTESRICLEFDRPISIDKTLEIIGHQIDFLNYVSYRKNTNLKSISVFSRNEDNLRSIEGDIFIRDINKSEENEKKARNILTFEMLEGETSSIFQSISDGEVYLNHICDNIKSRNLYNTARIILLFAAFEREYKNFFYEETVRSDEYFKLKSDVIKSLDKLIFNSKSKKYIESFKRSIDYNDNILSACIIKVMKEHIEIVKIFLKSLYGADIDYAKLINTIAQRLGSLRNNIAHGNLDLDIKPEHISDLKILESLIYMIRLNSLKIDKEIIQKGICNLIGYNIML